MHDQLIFKMSSKTWEVDRTLQNSVEGYVMVSFPASSLLCGRICFAAINFYFEPEL